VVGRQQGGGRGASWSSSFLKLSLEQFLTTKPVHVFVTRQGKVRREEEERERMDEG
jgi:hypothetical protein